MRIEPSVWEAATSFAREYITANYADETPVFDAVSSALERGLKDLDWCLDTTPRSGPIGLGFAAEAIDSATGLTLLSLSVLLTDLPVARRPTPPTIIPRAKKAATRCGGTPSFAEQFADAVLKLYQIDHLPEATGAQQVEEIYTVDTNIKGLSDQMSIAEGHQLLKKVGKRGRREPEDPEIDVLILVDGGRKESCVINGQQGELMKNEALFLAKLFKGTGAVSYEELYDAVYGASAVDGDTEGDEFDPRYSGPDGKDPVRTSVQQIKSRLKERKGPDKAIREWLCARIGPGGEARSYIIDAGVRYCVLRLGVGNLADHQASADRQ